MPVAVTERTVPLAAPPRSLGLALFFVAAAVLTGLAMNLPEPGVIVIALPMLLVTGWFAMTRRSRGSLDWFEIIFPFSIVHILAYGVGTYFLRLNPRYLLHQSSYDYLLPALALAVAAYLFIALAYAVTFPKTRPSNTIRLKGTASAALVLATVGFVGQTASVYVERSLTLGRGLPGLFTLLQQLSPALQAGWFLSWHIAFTDRERGRLRFVAPAIIALMVAAALWGTFGGKSYAITMLALPAIAYWYARRTLPMRFLFAVLLVTVFVIFPIYNTYRIQSRELAQTRRLERSLRVITEKWDSSDFMEGSVNAFLSRMAVVTSPAAVVRYTGRWESFQHGESLAGAAIGMFVPRILWPNKPPINNAHEFGKRFDLINPIDVETFVALTLVGEMYWNFGILGVVVGGFCVGAVFRWIYVRYGEGGGGKDDLRKAIYLVLLVRSMSYDGNVLFLIAGWIEIVLLLHVLFWILERRQWVLRVPVEATRSSGASV